MFAFIEFEDQATVIGLKSRVAILDPDACMRPCDRVLRQQGYPRPGILKKFIDDRALPDNIIPELQQRYLAGGRNSIIPVRYIQQVNRVYLMVNGLLGQRQAYTIGERANIVAVEL